MNSPYNPKQYWETRLGDSFTLRGVGHQSFGENYNHWLYKRKRSRLELCLRDVSLEGKDVLDIGCGTGFFVDWYLRRGAKVTGLDITETSIRKLQKIHPQGCFYAQDITDPAYIPLRQFDIVNMWDVIYHVVDPAAFSRALEHIARSLKPGGLLLITDRFASTNDVQVAEHVRFRGATSYQRELPSLGLCLESTHPLFNWLNRPKLGKLDHFLGGVYFALDEMTDQIVPDNLALAIWRKDSLKPA